MTIKELLTHLEGLDPNRTVYIGTYNMEDVVDATHIDTGHWQGTDFVVISEKGCKPCPHETRLV